MMRYKGINYDIGTRTTTGKLTRETFDEDLVTKELGIIKNELHCNAIRISGFEIERIAASAKVALKLGLKVWFSPALQYENRENTLQYLLQAAEATEKLRLAYSNVVLVTGCELSLFTSGFIKGNTGEERIKNLFSPISLLKNALGIKRTYNKRLHTFLSTAVAEIKKIYKGELTYASGTWEKVDWSLFDMIGVDLYRSSFNRSVYLNELQRYLQLGKPLVITEFGCCAYKGADDKGAMGWAVVDWKKSPPQLKGDYIRDESVQENYLLDLLALYNKEKVAGAFAFTFASYNYIHNEDPKYDLDLGAFGIVKVLPKLQHDGLPWIPKKAFYALGAYYKSH